MEIYVLKLTQIPSVKCAMKSKVDILNGSDFMYEILNFSKIRVPSPTV